MVLQDNHYRFKFNYNKPNRGFFIDKGLCMNGWIKQSIITLVTTAVISTVTTIAASQVALAVINEKLSALDARTAVCERNCEKLRDDIYKPSWYKD